MAEGGGADDGPDLVALEPGPGGLPDTVNVAIAWTASVPAAGDGPSGKRPFWWVQSATVPAVKMHWSAAVYVKPSPFEKVKV